MAGEPVYSRNFGIWKHQTGEVDVANLTGNIWVIRQVTFYNGNLTELNYAWLFDGHTGANLVQANAAGDPGTWWFSWEGRIVIPPSDDETLQGFGWVSGGFPIDVYVGGYELRAP